MNLKSVSPIVSVVLLIVATIAIGTILMAWGSGLLQEKQSVSEETSKAVFGNENYLSIDNLANSGGNLLIWIRNSGEEDVKVEYFRIYIEKNEIEQDPVDVSGMTVPKKGTVQIADIPLSLQEGDTVFVKITTKSGYVMTKSLNLAPKVTTTLSPPPTTPPPNNPPNADFDYDPPNPYTNDVIQFTDLSIDPDGTIVSWLWDFGDSQTSTDQNPTHSYPENNTYTVSLTVEDDDGATDTVQKDVTVLNQNPVADANGPYFGIVGTPITFDASGSSDDDGSIVLYEWDWDNDGTYDDSSADPTITHQWDAEYSGTVGLRVTDDDSGTDTDTTTVDVYLSPASFDILTISTAPTEIKQGDTGINVTMVVANTGQAPALVTLTDLEFTFDVDYTVVPDPSNPTSIAGGTSETFSFDVNSTYDATTGLVVIDGYIEGIDIATGNPISDGTADTPDQWIVEFFDNIENGSGKWTEIHSDKKVFWHITEERRHSDTHSWHYSDNKDKNYETKNKPNNGTLTSTSIDLTSSTITSATLRFWTWWEVEWRWWRDLMFVEISTDGSSWNILWQRSFMTPSQADWHEETIDISGYIGNNIVIRFSFDTGDGLY
ncbi:MAG: PKD domain-containing protein, partial [Methanomicrobia archaeon]|nr:PKD domain-containing protein [Methanomicrobia archaeon]